MKKIFYALIAAAVLIVACQPKTPSVTVNVEAEKAAIAALFDKYNSSLIAKDVNSAMSVVSEDALCCGTDPSEFWSKQELNDMWTKSLPDTSVKINYSIDKREIRLAGDGKTALIVEQYTFPALSRKIPIRSIYHAVKNNENWMIDYISWNFIPKNEDIPKLNKALEE